MSRLLLTALCTVSLLGAEPAHAQVSLTASGGASFPTGEFADNAGTGWMASLGFMKGIGQQGVGLGGLALYGRNPHPVYDGDQTILAGLVGELRWRLGDATKPGVFVLGDVGILYREYSSAQNPAAKDADTGNGLGAGVGFEIPRGRATWYVVARYMSASIENAPVAFAPIMVGVSIPMGSK